MFEKRLRPLAILLLAIPLIASGQFVSGRYIVELSGAPAAEAAAGKGDRVARAAEIAGRRAAVRAEQQALRPRIEGAQARVLDAVDTVANALIVRAAASEVARIAAVPGVLRVHRVREFKLLLDAAIPLHRVDQAWRQFGQDHAGEGVKIAVIDTGIDAAHPGFQDASLTPPDGYPKVNDPSDLTFTNSKVIVARSYVSLLPRYDIDVSARDRVGHGTALAMAAAGVSHRAPLAVIAGVAPKAFLGSYKIFGTPGYNDTASEAAMLKALDDAVADGMDIINLSVGSSFARRLEDDISVQAVERAASMGVIVVVSAGNDGPETFSISSPATARSAIAVGASRNGRVFSTSAAVDGVTYLSLPGNGPNSLQEVAGPLADVAGLDGEGLACSPLASGSLAGRVAFILRGTCTFEEKLNHAGAAGAVAALVYTDAARPDAVFMDVRGATLPAEMVSNADGLSIKQQLESAGGTELQAKLRFSASAVPVDPYRIASFSSRGPDVDGSIKPDIVAAGTDFYTATQSFDVYGDMFDATGYISADGTSFSAPLVAGAAALIKAARPGMTLAEYRSMLLNTAAPLGPNDPSAVQFAGAGLLDVSAAATTTATVRPASLAFGVANRTASRWQTIAIHNIGGEDELYFASVAPRGSNTALPEISASDIAVAAGSTAELAVWMSDDGSLAPGAYEGYVVLRGQTSGSTLRIPYWYAVPGWPDRLSILNATSSARAGSNVNGAVLFRVTDSSGVPLTDIQPVVRISGDGSVNSVTLREDILPGAFSVDLRLDSRRGPNVVSIESGGIASQVTIMGR